MSEDRPEGGPSRIAEGAQAERAIVAYLGQRQLEKFAENRHKPHWERASCRYLLGRLRQEVNELEIAMAKGHFAPADEVISECADVANFAAMIADNWNSGRGMPKR